MSSTLVHIRPVSHNTCFLAIEEGYATSLQKFLIENHVNASELVQVNSKPARLVKNDDGSVDVIDANLVSGFTAAETRENLEPLLTEWAKNIASMPLK